MKRILLVGRTSAGKTTLCQYLNHEVLNYRKTQSIQIFADRMIDTPGEYLEMRQFRGALSVTATQTDVVVFVQDATEDGTMFPPSFTGMFPTPVIGIVTKTDIASEIQAEKAERYLQMAGVRTIYKVSSYLGEGFEPLIRYLEGDDTCAGDY